MNTDNVSIRDATLADIPEIHRVHKASIEKLCAASYSPTIIEAWASNPNMDRYAKILGPGFKCLLATKQGVVCGYGSIDITKSLLASLFIHPDHAGGGVGALLLHALEAAAVEQGLTNLSIESSLNAKKFYEKHGYEAHKTGKTRFSTGLELDCAYMQKSRLTN